MKTSLPLNKANEEAILTALKLVNGRATTHTYTTYGELKVLEAEAKSRLDKLGITEKDQEGVKLRHQSGEQLPAAYGNSPAKTTVVELTRQGKQWVLTGVDEASLFGGNNRPKHALILPKELAAHAENAPRGLHVAVEAGKSFDCGAGTYKVPHIDQKQTLDQVVAERQSVRDKLSKEIDSFCSTPAKIAAMDRELDRED